MPVFRIVYIDDDSFAPRTLTAAFTDRAAAEIAMAKHGHRVVHMAELGAGGTGTDPVRLPVPGEIAFPEARASAAGDTPAAAPRASLGLALYEIAGVAAAGVMVAGVAYLLL